MGGDEIRPRQTEKCQEAETVAQCTRGVVQAQVFRVREGTGVKGMMRLQMRLEQKGGTACLGVKSAMTGLETGGRM